MTEPNQLTRALEITAKYALRADGIFKEMGKVPYGKVKATPKEQRAAFDKLKLEDVKTLVQEHGLIEVQKYFKTMRGK